MTDAKTYFIEILSQLKKIGVTQKRIAIDIEVTEEYISRIKKGFLPVTKEIIDKLKANYPNIDIDIKNIDFNKNTPATAPSSDLLTLQKENDAMLKKQIALQDEIIALLKK